VTLNVFLPFLIFAVMLLILWGALVLIAPEIWRGVDFLARLVARRIGRTGYFRQLSDRHGERWKLRLPFLLIIAAGGIVALALSAQFLDLIEALQENSPKLTAVDEHVGGVMESLRTSEATVFFELVTDIGSPVGLSILAAIVAVVCIVRKEYSWAAYLVITVSGGILLMSLLKLYFGRERPAVDEALRAASGYSFPSGHAMTAVVVFAAFGYLAVRGLRRWRWIALVLALCLTGILAVGLSRVYLGVHWISDIAAGAFAGTLWVVTVTVAYEILRRLRALKHGRIGGATATRASEGLAEA
jgi:membrane-associated phospholipid phosphatase